MDVEKFVRHLCRLVLRHQMPVWNYFVNSFYSASDDLTSLACLWSVWACQQRQWRHSFTGGVRRAVPLAGVFMAVPMTPLAAVADFGGQRYHRFIPFNFLLSLAAPHLHGVLVLVTGNKFIAGVVVTGDKVIASVIVTGDKLFTGIRDTGDHWKSVTKINRRCCWHRR